MSDMHEFAGPGSESGGVEDPHLTKIAGAVENEAGRKLVVSWQGTYTKLLQLLWGFKFFTPWSGAGADKLPAGGSNTSTLGWSYPFASAASIRREEGGVGVLELTITQARVQGVWGLDFAEVSKPIISWRTPGTPRSYTGSGKVPDVATVRAWQKLGAANPAADDYVNFRVDGVKMSGATLKLAQMIYRGIESYVVYVPVVTWQCRVFEPPDISIFPMGQQLDGISAPHGIPDLGEKQFVDNINGLVSPWTTEPYIWVRTANKVSTNADGTFTWLMQFTAAEKADSDLYPET